MQENYEKNNTLGISAPNNNHIINMLESQINLNYERKMFLYYLKLFKLKCFSWSLPHISLPLLNILRKFKHIV